MAAGDAKEATPDGNHTQRNLASLGKNRGGLEGLGKGLGKRLGEDARRKAAEEALGARSPARTTEKQERRTRAGKEEICHATIWDPYPEG